MHVYQKFFHIEYFQLRACMYVCMYKDTTSFCYESFLQFCSDLLLLYFFCILA